QYMFCVARFAHYLKVMARDKVGGLTSAADLEDYLSRWLLEYTNASEGASPELKARHPLREAQLHIREVPGRPGRYACVPHLRPRSQPAQLAAPIRLEPRLTPAR